MDRTLLRKLAPGADGNGARQSDAVLQEYEAKPLASERLAAGSDSPFAARGFTPDNFKAYMQFTLAHAFPNIAGPAMSGNYMSITPAVLERNHGSLVDQQLNLDHRMKAYDPDGIPRDRIIGSIVATYVPKSPVFGGWAKVGIPEKNEDAPALTAMAVVWRLAEGVRQFLGDQLSGKKVRTVSIEQQSPWEHLGIYVPSTREIHMLLDAPDELLTAVSENPKGGLRLGKTARGEQLAWAYGGHDGLVEFHGTGVVDRGADRRARIEFIRASMDQGELCALPSCEVPTMLVDREIILTRALSGARGHIRRVHASGPVAPPHKEWEMQATPCDPVLEIQAADGSICYWRLSEVTFPE